MSALKCFRSLVRDLKEITMNPAESYRQQFIRFFRNENVRRIWQEIESMPLTEVMRELVIQSCSTKGSEKILRERLLRAQTRLVLGEILFVPWLEKYDVADSEHTFVGGYWFAFGNYSGRRSIGVYT